MPAQLTDPATLITLVIIVGLLTLMTFRLGLRFVVRRLAGLVFVILAITFVTFIMGYFAPGDAAIDQLGNHATQESLEKLRHFYGLDLPWYQQYGNFLARLAHLDLGYSYSNDSETVWTIIRLYLPASITLGIIGTLAALVLGIPLGLFAAVRANTRMDTAVQGIALILYALPAFVFIPIYQIVMVKLFQAGIPILPVSGWNGTQYVIAPVTLFAAQAFAYYTRFTRSSMLEVLRQDYVRTARAKGLAERTVIVRHAFRNALIPLLTAVGPALAFSVAGLFITETLFNIPGIGAATINAISARDFPVVQGTIILLATAVVLMNLVTDVAYGFADPRIRSQ
jgi:ABC-type dipeptide/oligopeptide/nickel transport system permease component